MLVVFQNTVLNLDHVAYFDCQDYKNNIYTIGFYSEHMQEDDDGTVLERYFFNSEEKRDKVFRDILIAYQQGMKVLAILPEEEKKNE